MSPLHHELRRSNGGAAGFTRYLATGVCLLLLVWFASGCVLDRDRSRHLDASEGRLLSRPPDFLTGPASVLLTNQQDFNAHLVVSATRGARQNVRPVSGNLFHQQGRLLFVPTVDESSSKSAWAGSFRFLWDVQSNTGFVLSEPLQGFARVNALTRFFPGLPERGKVRGTETVDEQPCRVEETTITSNNGMASDWRLWRAVDLNDLTLRVTSLPDTNLFGIELSKVEMQSQIPDLFQPPFGFTQYRSPEALVSALLRHQRRPPPPDVSGRHGRY